ncbi:MAG: VWA domain-containing protein, partial [Deltaproteobacteria bacterium]|nr:VWA domain-containing protein [Deltaproteobacteria bacterium]
MNLSPDRLWMVAAMAAALVLAICVPQLTASARSTKDPSPRAFIVLDGSGSMWGRIEGEYKIRMAKRAVGDLLESLDPRIQLGLISYGNTRKNDCSDISTLVSLEDADREHFGDVVNSIVPRGMTPLSDAIEVAAQQLDYTHVPGNIILLSDGVETCDRDPCALATKLAKDAAGLRIHVIAFDLTAEEQQSLRCLSTTTGGAFLPASDASSLKDALQIAVKQVAELPPPPPRVQRPPDPESVSIADQSGLRAPRFVPAGWSFKVHWVGTAGSSDYVTMVPLESADAERGNYTYASLGNPLDLIAAIDPGEYELRYVVPRPHAVLARRRITVVESDASLLASEFTSAGATIEVQW